MDPALKTNRRNNFDLLRVLAALQVVQSHATEHLQVIPGPLGQRVNDVLALFPGVAIFFVISGFLISQSYERAPGIGAYMRNRVLRIYPALWVCFGVSLAMLAGFGVLTRSVLASPSFWMWTTGQLTIAQFFNPDALRTFGVGVLNGSLWTIPVEVEFYILLPLVYRLCVRGRSRTASTAILGAVALSSFAVWCLWQQRLAIGDVRTKLLQVTLAPHLFMFLLGMMLQRNWDRLAPLFEGRAALWLGAYLGERAIERAVWGSPASVLAAGAAYSALASAAWFGLLALVVVSVAHTWRGASQRTLRGHDISYGIYIYHMLVVNLFVQLHLIGSSVALASVIAVTIGAATASWICVERPALRLKQSRPRAVTAAGALAVSFATPLSIR